MVDDVRWSIQNQESAVRSRAVSRFHFQSNQNSLKFRPEQNGTAFFLQKNKKKAHGVTFRGYETVAMNGKVWYNKRAKTKTNVYKYTA